MDIIQIWETNNFNSSTYSSIISGAVPFNFIILPFLPFLFLFWSKYTNWIVSLLNYVPIAIFGSFVVGGVSFLMIVPSYLITVYNKLILLLYYKQGKTKDFLYHVISGLPVMFYLWFWDLKEYVFDLFKYDLRVWNEEMKPKEIS